jgi:NADPH:quinone reductase-like Zn-dependent oxidoreductase
MDTNPPAGGRTTFQPPHAMKALSFSDYGDPSVLRTVDVPTPPIGQDEVLIRVRACAVNALDIKLRRGDVPSPIDPPVILGADIAGDLEEQGAGTPDFQSGSRVVVNPRLFCGHCKYCLGGEQSACGQYRVIGVHRPGGYAQFVAVPAANLAPIPDWLSYAEAAAIPLTFTTAWRMLHTRARLQPGETVLVLSASGGVASAAVQIAAFLGARVVVTTSVEKAKRVEEIGAAMVITDDEDLESGVEEFTHGCGVDVLVQTQGGDAWGSTLALLAPLGRVVVCSAIQGGKVEDDLMPLINRQLAILGSTGGTPIDFARVWEQVVRRRLRPRIEREFALVDGAAAHQAFEQRRHVGKLVLTND